MRELMTDGAARSAQMIATTLDCRTDTVRKILSNMVASGEMRVTTAARGRHLAYVAIFSAEAERLPRKKSDCTARKCSTPRRKHKPSQQEPGGWWPAADPTVESAMRAMVRVPIVSCMGRG
jgi:hypothetical protein